MWLRLYCSSKCRHVCYTAEAIMCSDCYDNTYRTQFICMQVMQRPRFFLRAPIFTELQYNTPQNTLLITQVPRLVSKRSSRQHFGCQTSYAQLAAVQRKRHTTSLHDITHSLKVFLRFLSDNYLSIIYASVYYLVVCHFVVYCNAATYMQRQVMWKTQTCQTSIHMYGCIASLVCLGVLIHTVCTCIQNIPTGMLPAHRLMYTHIHYIALSHSLLHHVAKQ